MPSLFVLLPFLLASCSMSQPYKNITLGSSLSALNNGSFWPSPSGHYAFGFQQFASGDFLLAIWFNKIAERTVVWSANPQNLVPRGSQVQLTNTGKLLLTDPQGNQIWNANSAPTSQVSHAAMLDTGNLVLFSNTSQTLWQSFNEPTDTILPSQIMNKNQKLVARYSDLNFSGGRFQVWMQGDGNLVFYPTDYPLDTTALSYWDSKTVDSGFQLVFNLSGSIYVAAQNGSVLKTLTSNTPSTSDFYHRAILEYDGVFRQYVYPKIGNGSSLAWAKAWTSLSNFIPSNICLSMNNGVGSGACGFNSYCSLGTDQRPACYCPQGYDFIDPKDATKGCRQSFLSQSCDEFHPESDAFEFASMANTDWPMTDYGHFQPVSEDWCRKACLDDCFCAAAIFRNGECWKKKFPLSFGRINPGLGGKALIKIRKDNSSLKPNHSIKEDKDKTSIVVWSVLLSSSLFLNIMLFALTLFMIHRFRKNKSMVVHGCQLLPGMSLRNFSYKELDKATRGFAEHLGSGAFATVYKGIIDFTDSMEENLVAVKKLENRVKEGDQEFKAEVSAIARTNHKNLVRLLGFCNEGQHRLLVYEFMPNGSVADFIFGPSKPNWYQRIQVALGTARGLCYLHEECSTQIIHCDIKPQNILLDDSFTARISDFGLAKLLKINQTRTTTIIRGTKGYVAPEWFRSLPITAKVDVYSFGIVLLEIISCRKSFEGKAENEDEMVLADWACDCFKERKVEMLVGNDEEAKNDMKMVEKFVMIGIWCIQEEPSLRPTMKKVIQMLEGAVEVPIPPDPSSFISSIQ